MGGCDFLFLLDLLRFQMIFSKGHLHGNHRSSHTILPVGRSNSTAMHVHNRLTQVQSDTRAIKMQIAGITALVEPLEESFGLILLQSDTVVNDSHGERFTVVCEHHINLSVVEGVFERITQQVTDHLVEVNAVYPHHQLLVFMDEVKADVALLRIIIK